MHDVFGTHRADGASRSQKNDGSNLRETQNPVGNALENSYPGGKSPYRGEVIFFRAKTYPPGGELRIEGVTPKNVGGGGGCTV